MEKAGATAGMQAMQKDGVEMTRVFAAGLPSEAAAKRLQKTLLAAGYADTVIEETEGGH